MLNDAFWRWFGKSVVRNKDGSPMVVYHGTMAMESFTTFRPRHGFLGMHFGTKEAADHFVADYVDEKYSDHRSRIYPVYLSIQNPYYMADMGGWESDGLFTLGGISQWVSEKIISRADVAKLRKMDDEAKMIFLRAALNRAGYDGIIYDNETEDIGSESYLIWNPGQVKSATGNRGTWDRNDPSILNGFDAIFRRYR